MLGFAPKLTAIFLCGAALAGCSSLANTVATTPVDKKVMAADTSKLPTDLEGGIRQAQMLRNAGQYDEAIRTTSQLMLVASDDARVVSEYGKALTQKGRAQDAVQFLTRAIELAPGDWTLYSALGVSYDELGNQVSAKAAYDHALLLKANEPSVLNNYALSRMLAGDTQGAKAMMARAKDAGGGADAKIAANIALVDKLASAKADTKPATQAKNTTVPASTPVSTADLPPAGGNVVMQNLPADPKAGPVKPATKKPTSIVPAKTDDPTASAADQVPALRLTADARTP